MIDDICCDSIHDELINIKESVCPFCNELLIKDTSSSDLCCENPQIFDVGGMRVCISCGLVHNAISKSDYIEFYENLFRLRRKSIYIRKYHIENTLNDLLVIQGVELTHNQRTQIYKIFELIGYITNQINENRKRIISVKYLLKRIFDMMDIKYNIPVTKSIRTLNFYNAYWERIMTLIGDKIESILCDNKYKDCYLYINI